jgi:hypothetical protein
VTYRPSGPHPTPHHPGPCEGRGGAHSGANRLRPSTGSGMGTTPSFQVNRHRVNVTRCCCASPLRPSGPRSFDGPGLDLRPRPQVIDGPGPGLAPHLRSPVSGHRSTSALWISRYGANEGPIRATYPPAPHPYGPGLAPHLRSTALRPRPRPRCTIDGPPAPYGPVQPRPWCIDGPGPGPGHRRPSGPPALAAGHRRPWPRPSGPHLLR